MKRRSPSSARLVFALGILFAAIGCSPLQRPYPKITEYAIEPAPSKSAAAPGPAGVTLKVRTFRIAPLFDSRKLIYRRPGPTWESDFYHEFLVLPGPMIGMKIEKRLAESGVAGEVAPGTSQISPTHELEGTIQELFADFSDPAAPRAIMTIECVLLDERRGPARIAMHKTYREEVKLPVAAPAALVAGWGAALAAILASLESDLAAADWTAQGPAPR